MCVGATRLLLMPVDGGRAGTAGLFVLASVLGGIAAAALGWLGRSVIGP